MRKPSHPSPPSFLSLATLELWLTEYRDGRPQSESAPTTSEQLALDAEMDGSAFGAERAEDKRRKDEEWARYTEANPRGAGNTMNRG